MQLKSVKRTDWIKYEELNDLIGEADISLGIFPLAGKGCRVIPNKLFQIMATGRPLITADTPAIREILTPGPGLRLVSPGDPCHTATQIIDLADALNDPEERLHELKAAQNFPLIDQAFISRKVRKALSLMYNIPSKM